MEFNTEKFAEYVKRHRSKMSLRELGALIGVSAATLSRCERGNTPDVETLLKACKWMGVTVEQFATDQEREELSPIEQLEQRVEWLEQFLPAPND